MALRQVLSVVNVNGSDENQPPESSLQAEIQRQETLISELSNENEILHGTVRGLTQENQTQAACLQQQAQRIQRLDAEIESLKSENISLSKRMNLMINQLDLVYKTSHTASSSINNNQKQCTGDNNVAPAVTGCSSISDLVDCYTADGSDKVETNCTQVKTEAPRTLP